MLLRRECRCRWWGKRGLTDWGQYVLGYIGKFVGKNLLESIGFERCLDCREWWKRRKPISLERGWRRW